MGSASSKADRNEALRLCKERRRFIKQAIDSRYSLAASHVSYINSLKNIGIALRRYAEAEILMESSLSTTSATELYKTPSHSSYPSPSPSHVPEASDSPLHNESPISPPVINISYMRVRGATNPVTVKINLNNSTDGFVEDESFCMPMPPPPPPFESGGSWDYFDPSNNCESFRFVRENELDADFDDARGLNEFRGERVGIDHNIVDAKGKWTKVSLEGHGKGHEGIIGPGLKKKDLETSGNSATRNGSYVIRVDSNAHSGRLMGVEGSTRKPMDIQGGQVEMAQNANGLTLERSGSKKEKEMAMKDLSAEREDPSEFITHRAKDFLSSIKDIEHRFFRASESGKEVSRMLEANNIRVGYSERKGSSSASAFLTAFHICCRGKTALVSHEHVTKVITWKRTASSRSSSSRNPLAVATRDDISDSGSDFVEEFCMIAGSHSSTLDRLYAWERKLYDEVKASESIRKDYDQKCDQLRHQFAKDHSAQVIDKTRAVVKDLHSRIIVAIHSVDTISKRIEKMRDEELQPQLLELIQGLIRMWKAMLECHHAQYITISLAYHSRNTTGTPQGDTRRQIVAQLVEEIECFGLSFANWVNSHASYVEALNGWLQNCILQPQERSKSRKPFSPRRALAPPIFVLCRDWSAGIKALPSEELGNAIKTFISDLCHLMEQQVEQLPNKENLIDENNGESGSKDDEKNDEAASSLSCIQASLTKVLDRLNKFSEASLKMYEDIRQKSEAAQIAYLNCRPVRY
ncbi:protein ALTERED PHOSPHATE STARVATION RESPONSE 1 isoform X2 [Hevea brasiliensis]|uniref:protein ALTERED PHOSPHATE STARVATION RESPONSE 1 isoform X2 n=1 Tax=Hevea brasiliensis TaxID=3981 RepID=UPI0025DC47FB|nr:protein ALTERED PHOSPHATE STARVATION RESPONSE 1 isoform X2 [Hevea brasiliensis]